MPPKSRSSIKRLFSEFPGVSTEEWEKRIQADIKGQDYQRTLGWKLTDDINLRPYYRSGDLKSLYHLQRPFPFMDRPTEQIRQAPNSWEIRQNIREPNISQANAKARLLLRDGVEGVVFGVQTQEADQETLCKVSTPGEMQALLEGIELESHRVHFLCGLDTLKIAKLLHTEIQRRGAFPKEFYSCMSHDFFSHWLRQGGLPYSLSEAYTQLLELLQFCMQNLPGQRCLCISGEVYRCAGLDPIEELSLSLATGHELIANLHEKLPLDTLLHSIWFSLGISAEYFLEIARLRAARLLWPRIIKEYLPKTKTMPKNQNENSFPMHIHGQSLAINKTIYDTHSNILRTSTEGMAAVIGGADSFSALPFDTAYRGKSRLGEYLTVSTQLIHRHEAYLERVADPAGGSYYIEKLTDSIAQKAWSLFQEIEKQGGLSKLLQNGQLQKRMQTVSQHKRKQATTCQINLLGANQFPPSFEESMLDKIPTDAILKKTSRKDTRLCRQERIEAAPTLRLSAEFERLRLATERYARSGKEVPRVFLLGFGRPGMYRVRADFARNFFGCAGYEILAEPDIAPALSLRELIGHTLKLKAKHKIIALCSDDESYAGGLSEIRTEMKTQKATPILAVAARPEKIKVGDVFGYIYQGIDIVEELQRYHTYFHIPF